MIRVSEGRSRSERTSEEIAAILNRELDTLSEEERETLDILLKELEDSDRQGERLIDMMGNAEYIRTPIDMETFVLDPYFLGNSCGSIYPKLLEDLVELFKGGYHEAVFTGAIGYGKTFVSSIGLCRILYELSCMRDPQRSFGLAPNSVIATAALSVNELLAIKVTYENIANKVKLSPYFQEEFRFKPTKKELRFPKNIWVAARSAIDTGVLGLNIIGGVVDETNFMLRSTLQEKAAKARWGVDYSHAEVTYNSLLRRMKSRFERRGRLPGMLFVVSSKNTQDDFTAKKIRQAKDDPTLFVRDYSLWDVKPQEYFGTKKFFVLCGNDVTPSKILQEDEDSEAVRAVMSEGCVLVGVPEDFRKDFERDLEGAIRDIAGVATVAVSPFIQRREKILEAVDYSRLHPFSSLVFDPSTPVGFRWDLLVKEEVVRGRGGAEGKIFSPLLNPTAVRHVHIDSSLKMDSTGFCVAHIAGWKDVVRRSDKKGEHVEVAPIIVVDIILRVVPPIGDEIILGEVRRLVYALADKGFIITKVTQDSWQSVDGIQQLKQRGYSAEILSIDRTLEPYQALKEALYENRVIYYDYPMLTEELRKLEIDHKKKKVDHPPLGSKDLADALAGCVYTLSKSSRGAPVPPMQGESFYGGDTWLKEQQELAVKANRSTGYASQMDTFGMLPPFFTDSWSGDVFGWDDEWDIK
jgi:hypothetical protein